VFEKTKGTGTINGKGTYRFVLTAVDGALQSAGKPDKFRIRIWNTTSLQRFYDNLFYQPDDADLTDPTIPGTATTAIKWGFIIIQK